MGKKKALFIGGTGTISMAITRSLASNPDWELYLINRGTRDSELPVGVKVIYGDISNEADIKEKISGMKFDCVCDFIGFTLDQVERDYRLFKGITKQYMYISSASAYNKPCRNYKITEGTALANKYWQYSRDKIECEKFLMSKYQSEDFPITIIRPSHTYDDRSIPLGVHGNGGSWQVAKRMLEGKPVIIQGDGTSLWTMTYNEDFAVGFIGLMGNPHAIGEAFQIASDESITWNQIYEAIADALGVELKAYLVSSEYLASICDYDLEGGLIGDKSNTVVFDNSKIKAVVPEFNCTIRFEQGVKKVVENVLKHPEYQKEDPEFDAFCDKVISVLEKTKEEFKQ